MLRCCIREKNESKKELERFDIIRMYNLETLNKDINKEHKYYLIADIYFQYAGFKAITPPTKKHEELLLEKWRNTF